jgi:hypothetical protein
MEEVIQRLFVDGGNHPKVILCVPLGCRAHGGGRAPANHELSNQACADTNYFI